MLPQIAILGRPNVGKSSLLNALAGRRVSIVDSTPGTTRDRVAATIELHAEGRRSVDRAPGRFVDLIDTGGWGVYTVEGRQKDDAGKDLGALTPEIEAQILAAARRAAIVLLVLDARSGPMPLDERVAQLLRRERLVERVLAAANKVDDGSIEADVAELSRLGFGMPLPVSAKSGRGMAKLRAALLERLDAVAPEAPVAASGGAPGAGVDDAEAGAPVRGPAPSPELKVAIVGRRNAGKSSLVNALAGEPRVIVSEIAGTTRDSIDVRFEIDGRVMLAIDTAGVRKRKSWDGDIEYYSNLRTQESIRRADVTVLLLDVTEKVSQVEKNLAMTLTESWKPVVVALNKWDLVSPSMKAEDFAAYLEQELPGLAFAPIVCVSAAKGTGLRNLVAMCFNLDEQAGHRETTGRVNAAVAEILRERGPSSSLGTRAKVLYVTQIDVRPPTLAMVVNKPKLFEGSYRRYLENRLRDALPYSEVPIRLVISERRRDEWGAGSEGTPAPKRRAAAAPRRAASSAKRRAAPDANRRSGTSAKRRATTSAKPRTASSPSRKRR